MKKWKQALCSALILCGSGAFAAETYVSDGFSADIGNSGVIGNLKYKDQLLCREIQLNGAYLPPPGAQKHDTRFFQVWDYTGKTASERNGNTLNVTIDSKLGNEVLKDAADYKVEMRFTPDKITVKSTVKLNAPLLTNDRLFRTILIMPPEFFGRGVACVNDMNQERFEVLPETYNKEFKLSGKSIGLSTGKGTFGIVCGKEDSVSFQDSRMWGGNDFSFLVYGPAKWTPEAVEHPAGSTYSWEFSLTFEAEQ